MKIFVKMLSGILSAIFLTSSLNIPVTLNAAGSKSYTLAVSLQDSHSQMHEIGEDGDDIWSSGLQDMEDFWSQIDSNAAEPSSDKIVVSLGDSYSSGEGIENFYGYSSQHTMIRRTDESGKTIFLPASKDTEDFLAHRSEGSWPGQLKVDGIGKLKNAKGTNWYFEAVSGAKTINLGVDKKYFDYIDKMNKRKLQKGILTQEEYNQEIKKINESKNSFESLRKTKDGINEKNKKIEITLPYQLDIFDEIDCSKIEYVTMSMGGNDIGFTEIVTKATLKETLLHNPLDVNGFKNSLDTAVDTFENSVKYYLYASYFAIQDKAGDQAKILIAGYPRLFSEDPIDGLRYPFAKDIFFGDRQIIIPKYASHFNKMIKEVVDDCRINGGLNTFFVSVEEGFRGHEAYTVDPYIQGVQLLKEQDIDQTLALSDYSMHPNKDGAKAYANAVQKYINVFNDNGMISGFIYDDIMGSLVNESILKNNNVISIKAININSDQTYDINLLTNYGYYELYIPEGNYKIQVEYSSKETKKKYVQYGGKFDAEINIKKGEIIKDIDFSISGENPIYAVNDPEFEDNNADLIQNNTDEFKCGDNAYWSFDENSGVLTISGTGKMYNYGAVGYDDNIPSWWIHNAEGYSCSLNSAKKLVVDEGITSLGEQAFQFLNIENVQLPKSLKTINSGAFDNCPKLKSVTIPKQVEHIGLGVFAHIGNGDRKLDEFTIYGYSNSVAQKYANENDLNFVSIDDTNTEPQIPDSTLKNPYASLLNDYAQHIIPNGVTDFDYYSDIWMYTTGNTNDYGYKLHDLNNDGIEELFIFKINDSVVHITEIYTISNGKPKKIATGGARWNSYVVEDENTLCTYGSGGASLTAYTFYHLINDELVPFEYYINDTGTWYFSNGSGCDKLSKDAMQIISEKDVYSNHTDTMGAIEMLVFDEYDTFAKYISTQ